MFVQVAGRGLFIGAAQFRRHIEAESSLARILLLYTQALMTQIAQGVACASTHRIAARQPGGYFKQTIGSLAISFADARVSRSHAWRAQGLGQ